MTKIAICTPVYATKANKRLEMLKRAIESVQNQNLDDYEHFILDDGSTIDLEAYIDSLDDKHITYRRTSHLYHKDPVSQWALMLTESDGDYKIVLGSDDAFAYGALKKLSNYLDKHPKAVSVTGKVRWHDDGGIMHLHPSFVFEANTTALITGNRVHCCATLFRDAVFREAWTPDIRAGFCVDWDIWLNMNEYGSLDAINDVVLDYYRHSDTYEKYTKTKKDGYRALCEYQVRYNALERRGLFPKDEPEAVPEPEPEPKPVPEAKPAKLKVVYVSMQRSTLPPTTHNVLPLTESNFNDCDVIIYRTSDFDDKDPFVELCRHHNKVVISNNQYKGMICCALDFACDLEDAIELLPRKANNLKKTAKPKLTLKRFVKDYLDMIFDNVRVSAIIPVFERESLLKYTVGLLNRQTRPLHNIVCVGQSESERKVCEDAGGTFFRYRNKPLGAKWQYAVDCARESGATDLLYVGSSDWVSANWCEELIPYAWIGYDLIGVNCGSMARVTRESVQLGVYRGYVDGERMGEPMGAGRIVSKNALDRLDWLLFDLTIDNSLDWSMYTRIRNNTAGILVYDMSDTFNAKLSRVSLECDAWFNKHSVQAAIDGGKAYDVSDMAGDWLHERFPEIYEFQTDLRLSHGEKKLNILFVQHHPCIRNYKMAHYLKERGHTIYLLHEEELPMSYYNLKDNPYAGGLQTEITRDSIRRLIELCGIDAVHFHNRPDLYTQLLTGFDIPVVYDVHDPIQINLQDDPCLTFVFVNDNMLREQGSGFKNKFVIPSTMLNEHPEKPKRGGKMMYMSSFYWRELVAPTIERLKQVADKMGRDIDIFCSSKQYWSEITECIGGDKRIRLRGILSIDKFKNSKYEYGIYGIIKPDLNPVDFMMPQKVADYLSFGLIPYNFGVKTKFSKKLEAGKIPLDYFKFSTYYDRLMQAYRGT